MAKILDSYSLSPTIMIVAAEGMAGDWSAYIHLVRGADLDEEMRNVVRFGSPVRKDIAALLFPKLDLERYNGG